MLRIGSQRNPRLCSNCMNNFLAPSRAYAIAAETLQTLTPEPNSTLPHVQKIPPVTAASHPRPIVKAGIVLSRPPLLTKPFTPFEEAFFFYQKRLHERLVLPFSRYFYFKPDTQANADNKAKVKARGGAAQRELGTYTGYGEEAWNDELLAGDNLSSREEMVEALVRESEMKTEDGEEVKAERPLRRTTKSDEVNDEKALDRKLERTLYLVVRDEKKKWRFPTGQLEGRENLNQAAERVLTQSAGLNMNTWIVGHAPIGHRKESDNTAKTFFMKGRIMAGQANLEGNKFGWSEFKWLTREELQKHLGMKYYSEIKNMLATR